MKYQEWHMPVSSLVGLAILLATPTLTTARAGAQSAGNPTAFEVVLGNWATENHQVLVSFEENQFVLDRGDRLTLGKLLHADGELILVREDGQEKSCIIAMEDDVLHLELAAESWVLRRLASDGPIETAPYRVGSRSVTAHEVELIQEELGRRKVKDQEVLKAAMKAGDVTTPEVRSLMHANARYIRHLIEETGWIDADRFGAKASQAAFLLVQHSGDLRLMRAALIPLQEEALKLRDPLLLDSYGLLYDRVQLALGEKQRFGSQAGKDENGEPILKLLEDPERVNEYRAEIGQPPLEEYLALLSQYVFEGKEVRRLGSGQY